MSLFSGIGVPTALIVTKWSSSLLATLYYADNLSEMKRIKNLLYGKEIIIKRAKEAVKVNGFTS